MLSLFHFIAHAVQKHPRHLIGGLGVLLLGTGVTAFGIAPLAPDAAQLPVRQVIEAASATWTPEPLASDALPATDSFTLFRSDTTRRDDNAQSLLQRLGVKDTTATGFISKDTTARTLLLGQAGKLVSVEADAQQRMLRLVARWQPGSDNQYQRLVLEKHNGQWTSRLEQAELASSVRLSSGTIRTSLFAATEAARLPDSVAAQLAELFAGDIDFRRDLQPGDRFNVVYETLEADGEVLKFGRLLSAEFVNNGKSHQLMWFQATGDKGGYYNFEGQSMRRAFLASPLEFSRVSSGYGMRFHPLSGDRKPHLGIDYASPTGTPVRTVADGSVEFAGWQNGYGNVVIVQHSQNKSTLYAHLSRIHVRKGQRLEQGTTVGLVGSTGASTGAHLHFEYRVGKQHLDPLTIARQSDGKPVPAHAKAQFKQTAEHMRTQLSAAAVVVQASAQ
jgi:murein DD-endopeptidase MepM/ murein hydrolase activator NlpD